MVYGRGHGFGSGGNFNQRGGYANSGNFGNFQGQNQNFQQGFNPDQQNYPTPIGGGNFRGRGNYGNNYGRGNYGNTGFSGGNQQFNQNQWFNVKLIITE